MRCFTRRARQRITRKLKAAFAGLVGGFAFACSAPTQPGEMPPLAPRPEPMQPTPSSPEPIPGAPDPLDPSKTGPTIPPADGGVPVTDIEPPQFRSARPRQAADAGVVDDAGQAGDAAAPEPPAPEPPAPSDASVPLPPIPDALPTDANKRQD